jgi:hypothetical protein
VLDRFQQFLLAARRQRHDRFHIELRVGFHATGKRISGPD